MFVVDNSISMKGYEKNIEAIIKIIFDDFVQDFD